MKKLLMFIGASLLMAVQCDVDDPVEITDSDLLGNYKLISVTTENAYDFNEDGETSKELVTETGCFQNEILEFNSDNTGQSRSSSSLDVFVQVDVVNEEEVLTQVVACDLENLSDSFTWNRINDFVDITVDGEVFQAEFDGVKLVFTFLKGFDAEILVGDATNEVEEDLIYVFEKI